MEKLYVIKIGGNVVDDESLLQTFIENFAKIKEHKILVHGGGKKATELAGKLGVAQTIIAGRRVTDAATLDIAVMVYAGLINKKLVAKLQTAQCNALGFCGADGNLIKSKKRVKTEIDYGFVGDVQNDGVNNRLITTLLKQGIVPIICAITHDGEGNLLNTNADTIAAEIAKAMATQMDTDLIYCFETNGVLMNIEEDSSFIPELTTEKYIQLKEEKIIATGMLPKLDNAFTAIENGVKQVTICHAKNLLTLPSEIIGTRIIK